VLSFKGQLAGAEGLSVSASNFTIEDLAIEDAIGDALKINEGDNIVIRRVRTEWTNGPDVNNGAYGIYPVQTTNVLIEDNVAIAASDAGIYVGQSRLSFAAPARNTTSPALRWRIPSAQMSTTTSLLRIPGAFWCLTCRAFPNAATAPACSTMM
jgi:hypothetical protein